MAAAKQFEVNYRDTNTGLKGFDILTKNTEQEIYDFYARRYPEREILPPWPQI